MAAYGNYLRMRGEYLIVWWTKSMMSELPPHARRIRLAVRNLELLRGTTSACAENTERKVSWVITIRNYLRMRGEY